MLEAIMILALLIVTPLLIIGAVVALNVYLDRPKKVDKHFC